MRNEIFKDVDLSFVHPDHRVFFRGLWESPSIDIPRPLQDAFVKYAVRNLRAFPWRERATTPYQLLLAELLLVQTKASDVSKIWLKLIKKYPFPQALAGAKRSSLVELLRPLGLYNQRAKALRLVAKDLVRNSGGNIPTNLCDLLSVPHVGLYAASAVTCFAHNQRVPIVDANVLRVISRIFGLPTERELRRSRRIWAIAWALLPKKQFKAHNYALLDFAAQVCTSKTPNCTKCHIRASCQFGMTQSLSFLALKRNT